ncbi:MAG: sensor histidine kinase, partial [Cyanobacteria bacterium J06632_22]
MPALSLPVSSVNASADVASSSLLTVHSVLTDLSLHRFEATADDDLQSVAAVLRQRPQLPGVLVQDADGLWVAIARAKLFEACSSTLDAAGLTLAATFPTALSNIYLRSDTLILDAARQALRRPLSQQADPIVVETPTGMALLSAVVLNQAYWQLRGIESQIRYERLQLEQLQNEKMAALGRLVDGVAHEILDPISFIWGNLAHISSYTQTLLELVEAYAEAVPEPSPLLQQRCEEAEL